jgi:cytochrome c oxidase assembly factor CtaG
MRGMHRAGAFAIALAATAVTLLAAQPVAAHGASAPEPTLLTIFTAWSGEPLPWIGIVIATVGYLLAVRAVNRAHPRNPVPRRHVVAWLAGVTVAGVALVSALDVYADSIFAVHMVQHLLLAMVAPPLLALGAPTTLALRASTPQIRRRILLPILHSRLVKAITWPPFAWTLFTVVMFATHFSPLFDAALENDLVHSFEHMLYLVSGLLFWWPVIGLDPARWRLRPAWRMVYLAAQMPPNSALGLIIYFAPNILYPHYATLGRSWGPDPLIDQQVAGLVMWGAGDIILLVALTLAISAWLRAAERQSRNEEERSARHESRAGAETG